MSLQTSDFTDPMFDLICRYRATSAAYEAASEAAPGRGLSDDECAALRARTFGPLYDELRDSPPPIRSNHGAVEAIRTVLDESGIDDLFDLALIEEVIDYLQAATARYDGPGLYEFTGGRFIYLDPVPEPYVRVWDDFLVLSYTDEQRARPKRRGVFWGACDTLERSIVRKIEASQPPT
ncbi:hypothetical protein VQ045_16915 [Aurantimonas sp. E1-2-R+4]|uniref:hypothetical protein n=1 Tax=Aurantimonas sp. E1-2-R+4 TaxID=3113714 RepID=UPI002F9200A9